MNHFVCLIRRDTQGVEKTSETETSKNNYSGSREELIVINVVSDDDEDLMPTNALNSNGNSDSDEKENVSWASNGNWSATDDGICVSASEDNVGDYVAKVSQLGRENHQQIPT